MSLNPSKAVIFDLDGVLVDTGKFHQQSWEDLAGRQGWAFSEEIFRQTFGMQNYQIIPILAGGDLPPAEVNRLADWKEARYRELVAGRLSLLEGAAALINDLKKHKFLLAIGTSTPRENLDFILNQIPIRDDFDALVSGEEVSNGKPAPDTFLKAAEKLRVPAGRCGVVEDAVQGVQAARAAGMKVIAVATTRRRQDLIQADFIVDSLGELSADRFDQLLGTG